jgi:hypothetical protein
VYDGPLGSVVHCHCSRRCRRWHGAAFRTRAVAARTGFRFLEGEDLLSFYDSTPRVRKTFCRVCGSSLVTFYRKRDDLIGLPLAGVEGDVPTGPGFHIFVGSKADWCEITDGLPTYDALPPDPNALHELESPS